MYSNALQNITEQARLRTAEKDRDFTAKLGPARVANNWLSNIQYILKSGIKTKRALEHRYSGKPVYGFDPYGEHKAQASATEDPFGRYHWTWFNNYFGNQPLVTSEPTPRIRIPQLTDLNTKGGNK